MKILFVATVDIHIINHHLRIIHKLHELGHQVDLASNGDYINEDIHKKYNLCFSKKPYSLDNVKAKHEIKRIINDNQYDIVSCHTPLAAYYTRIAAKDLNLKMIYTAHGFHFYKGCPFINRTLLYYMEKKAAKYTDDLVTINREDYEAAKQFKLKKNGKVVYIPGVGVDIEEIERHVLSKQDAHALLKLPEDAFVVGSIGEINKNKDHMFTMKALAPFMKADERIHFIVFGKGPLYEEYNQWIKENNFEKQIHLLGYRDDVRKLLLAMDLFVSASHREGLPVSILEAMVVQLPILASNVRGNRDLVKDDHNGYLFEVEDSSQFAKCFNKIYKSESLLHEFGQNSYKMVQMYSVSQIDPMILDLYKHESK